jgi:hypothetical protein
MNDPFEDRFTDRNSKALIKSCGVFCASRYEPDNRDILTEPLMWAHYASNHSGIAIGLQPDSDESLFFKVDYLTDEEICKRYDKLTREYAVKKGKVNSPWAELFFKYKLNFWQYENEYRKVYIGAANSYINPHAKINEVIFGFRSRPEEELSIWIALRDKIKYRKANNRGGKIIIEEYSPPTHIETNDRYILHLDKTGIPLESVPEEKGLKPASFKFINKST